MGSLSIWHWLIVLVVVVLIFGTKKLRNIGSDVGGAVKNFKDAMAEEQGNAEGSSTEATPRGDVKLNLIEAEVIEVPVKKAAPRKRAVTAKPAAKKPTTPKTTTKPKAVAKPKETVTKKTT